ncbi:hypothetical protein [Desulforamulus profundi]|uniref:hypothetical protein n=1 Tax=Desulforamulus profundi TaxID=1383067 RepID=UPI001EE632D5|nr:hypothetical protein [Desulforamulus profundi]
MKRIALLIILILSLALTGCTGNIPKEQEQPKNQGETQVQTPAPEKVKVTLYFANEKADAWCRWREKLINPMIWWVL